MPNEAKLGLVLGLAVTIVVAIYCKPTASTAQKPSQPAMTQPGVIAPGQATSNRKAE